jgi:2-methylcitrate dehydratase PrpD
VDGQFSAPYSVAIACIEKKAFLEEYTLESIQRPEVAELMKKISINYDQGLDKFFPQTFPTRVTLTTEEGRTFVKDIKYPKGDPENPLSWEELLHKFDRLASTSMIETDKKDRIVELVRHFEKVEKVKDFMALLC